MPPLSLYVHLPWCVQKCPYCDFNSFTAHRDPPKTRYLDALVKDLAREAERVSDRQLHSVFLGGGTPSFFSPAEIGRILEAIETHFQMSDDIEITMEANPGTVECGDPAGYRAAGINRLSLGAQSFDDDMLKRLGRIHSAADIRRAFDAARRAGFDNINIDVMHALPGQDRDMATADLRAALDLQPEHLSWYQLTLEPNTVFYARPPAGLPDDDVGADITIGGQAVLAGAGYAQYEVSAYALPGRECRHNLNYWQFGDYLACGAGAHGKLTTDGPRRYVRPPNPTAYMQSIEAAEEPVLEIVEKHDRLFEFMLMVLRLRAGFSTTTFVETTGLDESALRESLAEPLADGLMESHRERHYRPTPLGFQFLNDLQARFLPSQG